MSFSDIIDEAEALLAMLVDPARDEEDKTVDAKTKSDVIIVLLECGYAELTGTLRSARLVPTQRGFDHAREHDRLVGVARGRQAQRHRERWRAVLLLVKSKLEIVRLGLSSLEEEFLANMVLPGGATVHAVIADALQRGLAPGELSSRLLGPGEGE